MLEVLNTVAPVKVVQRRKNFRSWVSTEVKTEVKLRDSLREIARGSQRMEDWNWYKCARNKCMKLLSKSKSDFYHELYKKIYQEKY